MAILHEENVYCPYCGETIEILVEYFEQPQEYIEDCQVCCRPIVFKLTPVSSTEMAVSVQSEDES